MESFGNPVSTETLLSARERALVALETLVSRSGAGSEFTGWLDLPQDITSKDIEAYKECAQEWRGLDYVVVIGIGGSYLGAKAALDLLQDNFADFRKNDTPHLIFAGFNMSEQYMTDLLNLLKGKEFGLIVISKSGTTTEPAVAFRILRSALEESAGKEVARKRIIAVTDGAKGALRQMVEKYGYRSFVIPASVGGRYSVLSPVGLLPLAMAGVDIESMLNGAKQAMASLLEWNEENPAVVYAATRNALYESGYKVELLTSYRPDARNFTEWWKQLFGESEGKGGKGIFPASAIFTTDLHSLGQFIQDGSKILFETNLVTDEKGGEIMMQQMDDDSDSLNYLAGKSLEQVNATARKGVLSAHVSGNVPNINIETGAIDAATLGELFIFFEISCGISAYMLGVNPFDQPGVEQYKKNMFALLGKPGYKQN